MRLMIVYIYVYNIQNQRTKGLKSVLLLSLNQSIVTHTIYSITTEILIDACEERFVSRLFVCLYQSLVSVKTKCSSCVKDGSVKPHILLAELRVEFIIFIRVRKSSNLRPNSRMRSREIYHLQAAASSSMDSGA